MREITRVSQIRTHKSWWGIGNNKASLQAKDNTAVPLAKQANNSRLIHIKKLKIKFIFTWLLGPLSGSEKKQPNMLVTARAQTFYRR